MAGDANEYEHATLLGGTRPLLEEVEEEDDSSSSDEDEEEGREGVDGKTKRRRRKKKNEEGQEIVDLPGIGPAEVKDKTVGTSHPPKPSPTVAHSNRLLLLYPTQPTHPPTHPPT